MFKSVKELIKSAISELEYIIDDGLMLSDEWIPDSVEKAKKLKKIALKSSFELMKVKKLIFEKKKGKIRFELEGGQQLAHSMMIDIKS